MLDDRARRVAAPALNAVAARLDSLGVPPLALTITGWLLGVGACVSAALGAWTVALILWLANRVFDGLDGPLARRRGATELGGFLDIVADFSIYAGFIVGVAIAVPTARLAALVLLSTYYVSGTAFLALSALLERRGASENDDRSLRFVGGLAEGTETVIVYVLFCSLPSHAELIAWIWSGAVAITAVQRVVRGVTLLRQTRAITPPASIEQCTAPDNEPPIEQQHKGDEMSRFRRRMIVIMAISLLALTACSSSGGKPAAAKLDPANWQSVLAAAKGQTVNWYMYGGDDTLNTFVRGYVADELKKVGVTLNQVKITDTSEAVNTVLGQKTAGKSTGGAVDAIWINGENFATGAQAKIWYCGWVKSLPNAKYVDFTNPAVSSDFGVPVNGCESVWQQADSALVYNSAALSSADVASVSALFEWAKAHPGRFTYPALPDFTGSMAVRTILYDTVGGPGSLSGSFDQSKYTPAAKQLFDRLNFDRTLIVEGRQHLSAIARCSGKALR